MLFISKSIEGYRIELIKFDNSNKDEQKIINLLDEF
jgi:hypothetical protein